MYILNRTKHSVELYAPVITSGQVARKGTLCQWRTQEFCSGGVVQQIQLRAEDREKGDLGAVAP